MTRFCVIEEVIMKDRIKIIALVTLLVLVFIFVIFLEVRVQNRWNSYENNVFVERGIR